MNPDGSGNQPEAGSDGQWGGPPPGYPQPGYPQPGQWAQGHPQPGPAGWGAPAPEVKVGIVPLRPLDLGTIYGGAFGAIRANPGVMVGLTAVFVVISGVITFLAQLPAVGVRVDPDAESGEFFGDLAASTGLGYGVELLAAVVMLILTAALTLTVARAVMGERTAVAQAVRSVLPRFLSLLGLTVLQILVVLVPLLLVGGLLAAVAIVAGEGGPIVAVLLALLLFALLAVGYLAIMPMFSLAYPAVVLERLGPIAALRRGYELQRPGFWRVLGILVFAYVIVAVVGLVIVLPFGIIAGVIDGGDGLDNLAGHTVPALAIGTVGAAVAQLVTAPFLAGVQTLLYVDQRMRNEQLDQVLRDEAVRRWRTGAPGVPTDALWAHRPQAAPSTWY